MKKQEYITRISERLNLTKKEVEQVTDEFLNELVFNLEKKDTVIITNFGTFKKTIIDSYEYFSPINGEKKVKHGVVKVTFSLSKELSKKLSKGAINNE